MDRPGQDPDGGNRGERYAITCPAKDRHMTHYPRSTIHWIRRTRGTIRLTYGYVLHAQKKQLRITDQILEVNLPRKSPALCGIRRYAMPAAKGNPLWI